MGCHSLRNIQTHSCLFTPDIFQQDNASWTSSPGVSVHYQFAVFANMPDISIAKSLRINADASSLGAPLLPMRSQNFHLQNPIALPRSYISLIKILSLRLNSERTAKDFDRRTSSKKQEEALPPKDTALRGAQHTARQIRPDTESPNTLNVHRRSPAL